MNRLLLALALASASIFPPVAASAQCYSPGYCAPKYGYAPSYYNSPKYCTPGYTPSSGPTWYNTWSRWTYKQWDADPSYFIYYRTHYDHCGCWKNFNDGWLYTYANGCYHKHCLISAYAGKPTVYPTSYVEPLGKTEVGYFAPEYEAAKAFPYLVKPGVIYAQESPRFLDPRSVLAPLADQSTARATFVDNAVRSTTDMALKIAAQEQANEAEKVRARNLLARQAQNDNTKLSILAKLNEIVATLDNKVTIDAEATPRAIINVGNPELARVIQDRCVSCHGPSKAEKGLNFAAVAPSDTKVWKAAYRLVATGQMPKGGDALTDEELDLFDEQYQVALRSSR